MEERLNKVFDLYSKWGHENYIGAVIRRKKMIPKTGEKVTQVQHAQQAAEQARKEGHPPQVFFIFFFFIFIYSHPPQVLLGALLHDIGL